MPCYNELNLNLRSKSRKNELKQELQAARLDSTAAVKGETTI